MRLGKIVLIAAAAVVAIIGIGVVVLFNLDFNEFKEQITAEVKKATGRELKIAGDLKLNLFTLSPGLTVDDVRFANARWASRRDMARIDRFEVKVAVMPLLGGTLDVKRVVLSGVDILIERNKAGRGNYEFGRPVKKKKSAKKKSKKSAARKQAMPEGLPAIAVKEVAVDRARLTYRDAATGQRLVLGIKRMRFRGGTNDPLEFDLEGDFNKAPFTVEGKLGPLARMFDVKKRWPVSVRAKAGGAAVTIKGSVANPLGAARPNVTFSVSGKDLSKLGVFAGAPVPPLGPYALSGRLTGSAAKTIKISRLKAKIGKSALTGKVTLWLKKRPAISATLSSKSIDLADFVKPDGKASGGAKAKRAGGKKSNRLFSGDPLPLEGLRAADAALDLTVKKLLARGTTVKNLSVKVKLRNGDLTVRPLKAGLARGKIVGRLRLNAAQRNPYLSVKISGKKIDIGKLLADLGITDGVDGRINAEINVRGRGRSVRQIMAGLNGNTSVIMGKGRMKDKAIDQLAGAEARLATDLIFGKQGEYTVINCFMSRFDITKGVARSKVMVLDTDNARVTGKGTINLATERIAYQVIPKPKSTKFSTTLPVDVRGTLAKPKYSLNKLGVANTLGSLFGARLFPQGTVTGLGEIGVDKNSPCLETASSKKPAPTRQPAVRAPTVQDLGKELEKNLKGLFGR